jgi:hypothetical protein
MSGISKLVKKVWSRRPTFRSVWTTLAEIAGFVAIVTGVALVSVPVSLIVGGILLIVAGGIAA